jgi:hypothetical protein
MESAQLFLSLFMSVMGAAYFVYGKKRPAPSFLVAGILMSFFGYFVESFWTTLLISAILSGAPFVLRFGE